MTAMPRLVTVALCILTGCTYALGTLRPLANRTEASQQEDRQACRAAAQDDTVFSPDDPTLFLSPLAWLLAGAIGQGAEREVFKACLTERGYTVTQEEQPAAP